jgi:hypothetical protein
LPSFEPKEAGQALSGIGVHRADEVRGMHIFDNRAMGSVLLLTGSLLLVMKNTVPRRNSRSD